MRNPIKPKSRTRRFVELQDDTGFTSAQFESQDPPIPWNAIGLAILLFLAGGGLLAVGILIKIGQITSEEWLSRGIPFIVLGSIMFIPGAYHLYIAYYAYYKYPGYDFSLIPDWD
ncbi:hypothetical protein G6F70_000931 [Rhizopus microsporus]|uniref:Transmembrane protein 230 n=1 Tax=Rhizopus azygosporus TaxID=86630 RepID=A0A367JY31_RHIAZ|nr:hypothetical protein G6F71_000649 [Rhizopus microsporus]RCH94828.1 hypothetical protein CU097_007246 [Rhizopus azygosporus]KAG1203934.1 hypothetical protein G6F70_000931 [Rhizopus microsporus]KAG1214709.1 hypothetical protein G6F69_001667 [Rhizopus microsporus]KAG1235845.1 hypothetical protein G6F67_002455 [Rhizopus microsporus]